MNCENISDIEHHLACCHYQIAAEPVVELLSESSGRRINRRPKNSLLVFVTAGEVDFLSTIRPVRHCTAGDFFIISRNIAFTVSFPVAGTVLFFALQIEADFCSHVRQIIFSQGATAGVHAGFSLKMNSLLEKQIETTMTAVRKGFLCTKFLTSQLETLLTTICAFYPAEYVADFFSPLVNNSYQELFDNKFITTIMQAKNHVFSVKQLAELTNFTSNGFRNHFKRLFNITPVEWITENRKQLIIEELTVSSRTSDEIATLAGFGSTTEFYRFCRKFLGKTAKNLRNRGR
jgi:AraC-like DNA-binding protein